MRSCGSCGAPLAPGATFCRACGHAAAAAPAPAGSRAPAGARRDAAVVLLAAPLLLALYVAWLALVGRAVLGGILLAGGLCAIVAPVALGLWRGASWGRPVGLVAAVLWCAFAAYVALGALDAVAHAGSGFSDRDARVADLVVSVIEASIGLGAVFLLLQRR